MKSDITALILLLISFALLWMSYLKFCNFIQFTGVQNIKYRDILTEELEESDLTYFYFVSKLMYNMSIQFINVIAGKLLQDFSSKLINFHDASLYQIHKDCFESSDSTFMSNIMKTLETYYNSGSLTQCSINVMTKNLNKQHLEFQYELSQSFVKLNGSVNMIVTGGGLLIGASGYFLTRTGIFRPKIRIENNNEYTQISDIDSNNKRIKDAGGGTMSGKYTQNNKNRKLRRTIKLKKIYNSM